MIQNISKTGNDLLACLMAPIILTFFYLFHSELTIEACWRMNEFDMLYFVYFVLLILPFLIVSDLILFNAEEVFHCWPIAKYFKFARHRFLTRIDDWKLCEFEFDET